MVRFIFINQKLGWRDDNVSPTFDSVFSIGDYDGNHCFDGLDHLVIALPDQYDDCHGRYDWIGRFGRDDDSQHLNQLADHCINDAGQCDSAAWLCSDRGTDQAGLAVHFSRDCFVNFSRQRTDHWLGLAGQKPQRDSVIRGPL